MSISTPKISVIITTYNWPSALEIVLHALNLQTIHEGGGNHFEVIIADDGSTQETRQLVDNFSEIAKYPIKQVWQEDSGFRAAMIRNKAVAATQGDYLIFLDGDCIPHKTFIERHTKLAEAGWFVAGNRILLSQNFTNSVLKETLLLTKKSFTYWCKQRLAGHCNRLLPLLYIPFPASWRKRKKQRWKGVKTCNLAMWRQDFLRINGLDEAFQGWGYEDSDLVVRLIHAGIYSKNGRFATPVFHLWHKENDRSHQQTNRQLLDNVIKSDKIRAAVGVDQYLA